MANLLDQMIEQISREKHIEPQIIVAAIEDAMVVAARKYYKTDEDLRAKFNAETGQVDVYSVRAVVDEVADPKKEMTLSEARKVDPAHGRRRRIAHSQADCRPGPHRRSDRQASHHAEGARGRARHHLQRI